ncbi:hypothetical protein Y1Q_0021473 [Alligator mississippiensis]|uniref:Uncharacterized protein n=1 Tax=Alligator mississippiensis TaxID=8496 RepID=A0A151PAQ4_ALLMI|nr:hypothetical protein Y1Q_0021473 [Alligator mississippiensis]
MGYQVFCILVLLNQMLRLSFCKFSKFGCHGCNLWDFEKSSFLKIKDLIRLFHGHIMLVAHPVINCYTRSYSSVFSK